MEDKDWQKLAAQALWYLKFSGVLETEKKEVKKEFTTDKKQQKKS